MFSTLQVFTQITTPYHPHSGCSAFPLALRGARVDFLFLKQFSYELETEAEVILTLITPKVVTEKPHAPLASSWRVGGLFR
jgi:hypothetical protein